MLWVFILKPLTQKDLSLLKLQCSSRIKLMKSLNYSLHLVIIHLDTGYPFPLYIAHKKVELKKKYAKSLARVLRNMARKDLKGDYRSIIFR